PVVSPVGGDGAFYLEGVPPGRHQAEVEWSRGRCRLTLVIPEGPAIVELGRVLCEAEADTSTIASTPAPASTPTAAATPIATPAPATTPTSTPVATAISAPTPTPPTPTATPAPPATRTAHPRP